MDHVQSIFAFVGLEPPDDQHLQAMVLGSDVPDVNALVREAVRKKSGLRDSSNTDCDPLSF